MQATYKLGARVLMIAALIGFVVMIGWFTDQVARFQVQRALARVAGADPDLVYRFAFSLMLLYLLLSTLPLLMIVAYRGLQADVLRVKVLETLSMCALNDDQVQQRLLEYEQRNSLPAFVLPALVNLMLLYLVWDNALLPKGIEGLLDQVLSGSKPLLGLAQLFPAAAASLTPLTWAMLGAYFYSLTLTVRRWMLYDLTTNVLWQIDVRLATTFVLGMLLMGLAAANTGDAGAIGVFGPWLAALAFLVGIVPEAFLNWITQQLKRLGGVDTEQGGRLFGPSDLQTKIDGMSFWQVGRLAEEGIESVHDLAMKEIPTLIIQTRFDPALLLDWVDRALLCKQAGADLDLFKRAHVYCATDAIDLARPAADGTGAAHLLRSLDDAVASGAAAHGANAMAPMTAAILTNIVQGLGSGPNLRHLTAYRANLRSISPPSAVPDPGAGPAPRYPTKRPPDPRPTCPRRAIAMLDYEVTADTLELRDGPGTQHPVLAQLPRGTRLEGLEPQPAGGWLRVRVLPDGRSGWVAAHWLAAAPDNRIGTDARRALAPAAAPAVAGPPTPTTAHPAIQGAGQVCDSLVFDLSHFNGAVDFAAAYAAGQRAVIHKATEGIAYVDPRFRTNRPAARAAGLLFGAYHFGTGDDPITQAEHFIATAEPDGKTLLVLDLETNPQGLSMSIAQARAFVTRCREQTGKWPGVYSGNLVRDALKGERDPVLGNCWFWLAEYSAHPVVPPTWEGWTLWQFTDGHCGNGPFEVPGAGRCDRDRFSGDAAALAAFWASNC